MKNPLISISIVSLLVAAGFLGFITFEPEIINAGGGIVYVDDDNAGYEDGSFEHPYNTIQEGVNASFPGDTVFVFNGTYNENVRINKILNLTGEDRDITIIDGGGREETVLVISSWVNITGFTCIRSGGTNKGGINLAQVQNCSIFKNNVSKNSNFGIYIYESSNNSIFDNNVFLNDRGIRLWAEFPSQSHYVSNNIISNNTIFSNNWEGIDLHYSQNNIVTGNNLSNNHDDISLDRANYNIITSNIGSNSGVGIFFGGSHYNLVVDNTITSMGSNDSNGDGIVLAGTWHPSNNNIIANNSISSCSRYGIAIWASSYNEIINNIVSNCSSSHVSDYSAINLDSDALSNSSHNIISNNNISYNFDHGIHIPSWALAFNNEIKNNIVSHNLKYGIYLETGQYNNITNNNVWDNLEGINVMNSYENKIAGNSVYLNKRHGIAIFHSNNTNVSSNNVFLNENDGINFSYSKNNNITGNNVLNNSYGISIRDSSYNNITTNIVNSNKVFGIHLSTSENNSIYHNYIINNHFQAYDDRDDNAWNDSYPSGGNYWSDFDNESEGAFDNFKGQDQNVSGGDGIVDKGLPLGGKNPYVIDADSQDVYPLIDLVGNYLFLYEGWNLISIPFIQNNQDLGTVLKSIKGSYDIVWWYNIGDKSDYWKVNSTSKPPYMNDLDDIDHKIGFWIHITEPGGVLFEYYGSQPTGNQKIKLYSGWNLVGYPSLGDKIRTIALNNLDFGKDIDSIWSYNAVTQKWEEIGNSDCFIVGRGYWIHALGQKVWDVPL